MVCLELWREAWYLLCRYHQEIREPLVLPQGSQVSIQVESASTGVRARECSGVTVGESGLNSHGKGNLKVFLEL